MWPTSAKESFGAGLIVLVYRSCAVGPSVRLVIADGAVFSVALSSERSHPGDCANRNCGRIHPDDLALFTPPGSGLEI